MYNPAHFEESRPEVIHEFIRSHALGTLISTGPDGLTASHIPMLLDSDGGTLRCHMARANPQWRHLTDSPLLVVFGGAEHYISPSWYKTKEEDGKVVPTWNYAAVHVSGIGKIFEGEELYPHLRQLTLENETQNGQPWRIEDAPRSYIDSLIKAIVGVEISITRIEGKWKMSQNRPERDRDGVIAGLDNLATERSSMVSYSMKEIKRLGDRPPSDRPG